MRAAVVPTMRGKWEVKEVPIPEPGPNQVLMKIHASGLCYTDVYTTNGMLPTQFPRTLGREPVGEIVGQSDCALGTTRTSLARIGSSLVMIEVKPADNKIQFLSMRASKTLD